MNVIPFARFENFNGFALCSHTAATKTAVGRNQQKHLLLNICPFCYFTLIECQLVGSAVVSCKRVHTYARSHTHTHGRLWIVVPYLYAGISLFHTPCVLALGHICWVKLPLKCRFITLSVHVCVCITTKEATSRPSIVLRRKLLTEVEGDNCRACV